MTERGPQCSLILENAKGEVVLQLRDNKPGIPFPNCIGTFGGEIELGETPAKAIEREIKEELDYDLRGYGYMGIFSSLGYDVHAFRKVDHELDIEQLVLREGQRIILVTKENKDKQSHEYAFNCEEILNYCFENYH